MKGATELAERILSLAELSRKMETDREMIAPFYETSTGEEPAQEGSSWDIVSTYSKTVLADLLLL